VLNLKSEEDIRILMENLDRFMGKIENACSSGMAQIMVPESAEAVMEFVKSYYKTKRIIEKELKEQSEDTNLTIRFHELQTLHGEMKDNKEYEQLCKFLIENQVYFGETDDDAVKWNKILVEKDNKIREQGKYFQIKL
jgi:light-regulated signal transduction histidine kinase (bacteriophytochrome)